MVRKAPARLMILWPTGARKEVAHDRTTCQHGRLRCSAPRYPPVTLPLPSGHPARNFPLDDSLVQQFAQSIAKLCFYRHFAALRALLRHALRPSLKPSHPVCDGPCRPILAFRGSARPAASAGRPASGALDEHAGGVVSPGRCHPGECHAQQASPAMEGAHGANGGMNN